MVNTLDKVIHNLILSETSHSLSSHMFTLLATFVPWRLSIMRTQRLLYSLSDPSANNMHARTHTDTRMLAYFYCSYVRDHYYTEINFCIGKSFSYDKSLDQLVKPIVTCVLTWTLSREPQTFLEDLGSSWLTLISGYKSKRHIYRSFNASDIVSASDSWLLTF
jgi:hypothetical protein